MICTNCGNMLDNNAKFCGVCGTPVQVQPTPQPVAQPQYQQPQQTYTYNNHQQMGGYPQQGGSVMSVGSYIITFIITSIPIVGFIMILVWSFGSNTEPNKKNLARALLIFMLIGVLFYIIFAGMIMSMFSGYGGYYY